MKKRGEWKLKYINQIMNQFKKTSHKEKIEFLIELYTFENSNTSYEVFEDNDGINYISVKYNSDITVSEGITCSFSIHYPLSVLPENYEEFSKKLEEGKLDRENTISEVRSILDKLNTK